MDFSNEKYEYLLHTWGGFYNPEYQQIHGKKEGYFFFDTMKELQDYLHELRLIEKALDAFQLMSSIYEGRHVRYRTVAKMKFVFEGNEYEYEEDFGYGLEVDHAEWMFYEGNYACDCNRSLFIRRTYGDVIEQKECGREIIAKDFQVVQIKK